MKLKTVPCYEIQYFRKKKLKQTIDELQPDNGKKNYIVTSTAGYKMSEDTVPHLNLTCFFISSVYKVLCAKWQSLWEELLFIPGFLKFCSLFSLRYF